jgi:transposase
VPGIGPGTARTLLASLPELRTLNRRAIAAWVGSRPGPGTAGVSRDAAAAGAAGRTALYMAPRTGVRFNPMLADFCRHLVAQGKRKKVALVACMRKLLTILNAMVRTKTRWAPRPGMA